MNILSYRGPSTPGGVSATLSRVIEQTHGGQQWWFLHGLQLRKKASKLNSTEDVCQIPFKIVEGHYRYCNEFLWPVLHELSEYASLNESDRKMYEQLNVSFAWNVLHTEQTGPHARAFVNDYQLALCPKYLTQYSHRAVDVFWHIPWPKFVDSRFVPYLAEIAVGLLSAEKIGFHIEQYSSNFLNFVDKNLHEYTVDFPSNRITRPDGGSVSVVSHPLGIDSDYWLSKSRDESFSCRDLNIEGLSNENFILSVDRADYTKGVIHRLQGIEHFFSTNADKIGKVTFVQVCQRTRAGLPAFEEYWQQCRALSDSINSRWGSKDWQPIVWIDTPVSANVLAWLYKRASAMLVTPLYDGLNLTAKEFALCSRDGILILSERAGAWNELSEGVLTLANLRPETISEQICSALALSKQARKERIDILRESVLSNTLSNWWQRFGGGIKTPEKVVPLSGRIHHTTRRDVWMAK